MLVRVLTEPSNSLLAQMKLLFAIDRIRLTFADDALEEMANMALERKTGARALRSILEKVWFMSLSYFPNFTIRFHKITIRLLFLGFA